MPKEPNYKAELVGVFGHPVAENPTIVMQEAAFRALDLNWRYLTIEVYPEDLAAAMQGLRAFNMRGINLTIPHKISVLNYLDEISTAAQLIGAVNTVVRKGDRLVGENTDGKGFMQSLRLDAGIDPAGKRVLVLGAGGAARAITVEVAMAGAAQITVVNRQPARGQALVDLLNQKTPVEASFIPWDGTLAVPGGIDLLVNATSIGLFPNVDHKPDLDYATIHPGVTICDVIPNPPQTSLLSRARARGARTLDGLGMLVYQGAIGFKLWTGLDAPVQVMRQALEEAFSAT
ncbi:MAG: shikimate dehydrogenase [Chloroflexi bacterium RBG_16_57_11]|nr:MAG: shikimate dehydrogenase [Chloroflexi bacterium RBG_16_57_11]